MSYKPFTTNYTWQIIDDIKEYLEETNKDQTTLDTLDLCHLIGEIEELKELVIALWHNDNARFLNKEQIDLLNNIVFGNDEEDLGSDKE